MAEAAEQAMPLPKGSTLLQTRLAEVYATQNPRSHTEALLKAGYSPATARSSAARQRSLAGVQNAATALQRRQAGQRDKARGILHRGLDEMARRMPDAQDAGVAAFTKVAADVIAAGVTEDERDPLESKKALELVKRYGRFCFYMGAKAATLKASEQLSPGA